MMGSSRAGTPALLALQFTAQPRDLPCCRPAATARGVSAGNSHSDGSQQQEMPGWHLQGEHSSESCAKCPPSAEAAPLPQACRDARQTLELENALRDRLSVAMTSDQTKDGFQYFKYDATLRCSPRELRWLVRSMSKGALAAGVAGRMACHVANEMRELAARNSGGTQQPGCLAFTVVHGQEFLKAPELETLEALVNAVPQAVRQTCSQDVFFQPHCQVRNCAVRLPACKYSRRVVATSRTHEQLVYWPATALLQGL